MVRVSPGLCVHRSTPSTVPHRHLSLFPRRRHSLPPSNSLPSLRHCPNYLSSKLRHTLVHIPNHSIAPHIAGVAVLRVSSSATARDSAAPACPRRATGWRFSFPSLSFRVPCSSAVLMRPVSLPLVHRSRRNIASPPRSTIDLTVAVASSLHSIPSSTSSCSRT